MMTPEHVERFENAVARMEQLLNQSSDVSSKPDPRSEQYRAILEKTVDALERTKSSFKSKQLKELREEIQAVLQKS